jgi:enediyne biosynthesis protein E4
MIAQVGSALDGNGKAQRDASARGLPMRFFSLAFSCRTAVSALLLIALLSLVACQRESGSPTISVREEADLDVPIKQPIFTDITASSGIAFTYRNGEESDQYTLLESLGGGAALLDFDGDGLLDVFIPGGGRFEGADKQQIVGCPCKLYRNLGGRRLKDVTAEVGLERSWFYTHGAAAADYDNDGWPDLLVTGWHDLALFHNEPADPRDPARGRKFVEVSRRAGLPEGLWTVSAAWGDLDGDGYADLYLVQYVDWSFQTKHPSCNYDGKTRDICPPKQFVGLEHRLFRNRGDGTFADVSKEAGLRVARTEAEYQQLSWLSPQARQRLKQSIDRDEAKFGKGLGVLFIDVNGDSKPDIYVANDTVDNFLYLNRGSHPGRIQLEERGLETGTARDGFGEPEGSMGVDAGDYDGSGRPSLWVTNFEHELHALYRNQCVNGRERFLFATTQAGLAISGVETVGWGTGFVDLDHDGWEDLVFTAGHILRYPITAPCAQRPWLFRNNGNGKFRDYRRQGGPYFQTPHRGRGAALGDLDNDGRIDLIVSHVNEPVVVLANEADTTGKHWLGVELRGAKHRDIVGARITIEAAGRTQTRFAKGGGSYASSCDRRHVFGLDTAERIDKCTVVWPSGRKQAWQGMAPDRYWRLTEGVEPAEPLYGTR